MILAVEEIGCAAGAITFAHQDDCLYALGFSECWEALEKTLARRWPGVELRTGAPSVWIRERLGAYFRGEIDAIDSLAVETGGSPFQQSVWAALRTIPHGRTISYRDLALTIGAPTAVRAVGLANGANPISIVIPCHRVVGSDGRLTGYAGGLRRKRWLLEHEGAIERSLGLD